MMMMLLLMMMMTMLLLLMMMMPPVRIAPRLMARLRAGHAWPEAAGPEVLSTGRAAAVDPVGQLRPGQA